LQIFKDSAKEIKSTRTIVMIAMLIAINLVLDRFTIIASPTLHISLKFITYALIGLLYGPVTAVYAGGLTDIVGYIAYPKGPFFPGFTASAMLMGFIYGYFLYKKRLTVWRALLACAVITVVVNIGLNSLWLSILWENAFIPLLISRVLKNIIMLPIETAVLFIVGSFVLMQFRSRARV
jgi:ECF transporter S component (folate family)